MYTLIIYTETDPHSKKKFDTIEEAEKYFDAFADGASAYGAGQVEREIEDENGNIVVGKDD